ncbi:MAG: glycosyltransferase family 39 protein [Phycisphaerae bacterium]|nr:glycosyltransferase family 39 protein [Phycisphaerae bacterium]
MKHSSLDPVWLLCGVALLLRVGWVVYWWSSQGAEFKYSDETLHWQLADNLIRHGSLVSELGEEGRYAARMPFYPLFLTLFAWLGQTGILIARLAQAVLGAGTVLIAYRLAEAAVDRRAALIAGLLICIDPFAVFFANLLLTEVLFTLLIVGLIGFAWRLLVEPTDRGALVGLALLGAGAIMTRPSAAGLIPLFWLLTVWLAADRRRVFLRLLPCPALLLVLLLPWGLRNKAVLGSFAWLSTNGGVTLYDAQGPRPDGRPADGSSDQAFLKQMPRLHGLDEVTLDQTLLRMAVEQMCKDPGHVLHLAGVKFVRMWSPTPNVEEYRHGAVALVSAGYTIPVLVGAFVGLVRTLITRRRTPAASRPARAPRLGSLHGLIWLPVIYFTLLHCIYIGSVRYRVPLMPLLALSAALIRDNSPRSTRRPQREK